MAKKRKRRPRAGPASGGRPTAPAGAPAAKPPPATGTQRRPRTDQGWPKGATQASAQPSTRRAHKEEARRTREEIRKRARRSALLRRGLSLVAVVAAAILVYLVLFRVSAPSAVAQSALDAAEAAGCGDVQTPADNPQPSLHNPPYVYAQKPATSGPHAATLPPDPHVYTTPVPEENAVHNLEHAYVLIYYRQEGDAALSQGAVQALEALAESEDKVIMAPYPELPEGTSLALAAWNKLWTCPSEVSPAQARTIASGFIDAYRGTSNAPEPRGA